MMDVAQKEAIIRRVLPRFAAYTGILNVDAILREELDALLNDTYCELDEPTAGLMNPPRLAISTTPPQEAKDERDEKWNDGNTQSRQ